MAGRRIRVLHHERPPSPPGKPIIIAAIAGSIRHNSTHKGLIRAAMKIVEEFPDIKIQPITIDQLPLLNTDLENVNGKPFPDNVMEFRQQVDAADAILFACPEYNYSVASPLKNAIDWASRAPNVWNDKPAAIVSAGSDLGGGRSQYHLRQIGVYLNLHFLNQPELFIRSFEPPPKFDANGDLVDEHTWQCLREVLIAFQIWILRVRQGRIPQPSKL